MGADEGLAWQVGVWDRISEAYVNEIDARFVGVTEHCLAIADLASGDAVLDLGTGTGTMALLAARAVGDAGRVIGTDISPEMLARARARLDAQGLEAVELREGRAEAIPAGDAEVDAVTASLVLMYVIDRQAAASEIARVLRPGGRLAAAVWAGPDHCDIVRFQATAGSFAPPPPVPGVGPGALADPAPFVAALHEAGINASVETKVTTFKFDGFDHAWDVLAGVTTANLSEADREAAKAAVREAMWPDPSAPRLFENLTQFIVGHRAD